MTDVDSAAKLAQLSPEQRAKLFQAMRERNAARTPARPPFARADRSTPFLPLSFAQQRLWFLEQFEPGTALYNIPALFQIRGPLQPDVLREVLTALVARHESLRTTFATHDDTPVQVVHPPAAVPLPLVDVRHLPDDERPAAIERLAHDEANRPFEIERGPLLRATLVRAADDDHLLLLTVHHIVYDGWSTGVLLREMLALYQSLAVGQPSPLPALSHQYADYAVWQRGWLQGEELNRQVSYWRGQLDGVPMLQLPTDRPRPAVQSHRGTSETVLLPLPLARALTSFSQQQGQTLFITLLAAFKVLLARYSGQEDIAVGTYIAGRTRAELEPMVGFFVNTLVLRTDLSGNPTFAELLGRVRDTALDAFAHQDLPFEKLIDELHVARDLSKSPLFQVLLVVQNAPAATPAASAVQISQIKTGTDTTKFDLSLFAVETPDGLALEAEYATDLFDRTTIRRMLSHLQRVLETVTQQPATHLRAVPLLGRAERTLMLERWNATARHLPAATVPDMLAAQASATPLAPAVTAGSTTLSYRELEQRATQIACYLRGRGIAAETRVGICTERTELMLAAMLGVLKAGGAYVPLDPEYPAERLAFVVEDAGLSCILTQTAVADRLPAGETPRILLDTDWPAIAAAEAVPLPALLPDQLAYSIYTSGSTGRPKGVQISHAALANFLLSMQRAPGLTAQDRLLAVTSLSFDIAGLELLLPLICGAEVVIASREITGNGELLLALLRASGATVMQATPASWQMLLDAGWQPDPGLRMLCGGEAFPRALANRLGTGALWNMYGPTETTIWSAVSRVTPADGPVLIGSPIANTQLYVLDAAMHPVPVGVAGELYIGGAGLSRGYLGRPDLTAERFVPDPFSTTPGARLYRTGDEVRYRASGAIEFLGRLDHQVKVRGFRIELGEIEAVLNRHADIRGAVVLAREDATGDRQLVAYLVPHQPPTEDTERALVADLRALLKAHLPAYMVPALFLVLESFPQTPNGKIDRKALPAPDTARPAGAAAYVAPRTPTEQTLAEIWQQVLGVERVGIHDNFFEIGGDSLKVVRVVARAGQLGVPITTKQCFQHQTIEQLAPVVGTGIIDAEQGLVEGAALLTPAQHQFFELGYADRSVYAIGVLLRAPGHLPSGAWQQIAEAVVAQHDALRLRLHTEGDERYLLFTPLDAREWVQDIDMSAVPPQHIAPAIQGFVAEQAAQFSMEDGPLFRVFCIRLGAGQPDFLAILTHYLAADVFSWQTLLADLEMAYVQTSNGEPIKLPAKTTSFQSWAARLKAHAQTDAQREEAVYWLSEARQQVPPLPRDLTGLNTLVSAQPVNVFLEAEETHALLNEIFAAYETQIDDLLLAAVAQGFQRWTHQPRLLISLLGHGRVPLFDDVDLSRTVGWINTVFPMLLDIGGASTPQDALLAVKRDLRALPRRGIGYGMLRYLSDDASLRNRFAAMPQADVYFNYVGNVFGGLSTLAVTGGFGGHTLDVAGMRPFPIAINVGTANGRLQMTFEYSDNQYHPSTIAALAEHTLDALRTLIDHCRAVLQTRAS